MQMILKRVLLVNITMVCLTACSGFLNEVNEAEKVEGEVEEIFIDELID